MTNGQLVSGFEDSALHEALDLCLACKACSTDCPTGVNLAKFKSEALYRGYRGKIRPRTHYILGNLPILARWATAIPGLAALANALMKIGRFAKSRSPPVGSTPAAPGRALPPPAFQLTPRACARKPAARGPGGHG
ncbi:sn-glycerol-3-phosphate dehydrogenase subunit C [Trueperella pyogenes]|uniref:hypothetical protein n=1 Tax=Trueperella pyogenes TaxID=1661 RepID=UPI000E03352C|nr:sn-glycerol-3-phosphate dehydrogenase subunit C [Trueperella pyogenes]